VQLADPIPRLARRNALAGLELSVFANRHTDRRVPGGDRQGEEALASGTESRSSVSPATVKVL